jgi:hypothetical protein
MARICAKVYFSCCRGGCYCLELESVMKDGGKCNVGLIDYSVIGECGGYRVRNKNL